MFRLDSEDRMCLKFRQEAAILNMPRWREELSHVYVLEECSENWQNQNLLVLDSQLGSIIVGRISVGLSNLRQEEADGLIQIDDAHDKPISTKFWNHGCLIQYRIQQKMSETTLCVYFHLNQPNDTLDIPFRLDSVDRMRTAWKSLHSCHVCKKKCHMFQCWRNVVKPAKSDSSGLGFST